MPNKWVRSHSWKRSDVVVALAQAILACCLGIPFADVTQGGSSHTHESQCRVCKARCICDHGKLI